MTKENLNSDPSITLDGYQLFTFEKEDCEVHFRGALHIDNVLVDIGKWIQSLAGQLGSDQSASIEYLASELVRASGLFSLVIRKGRDFYLAGDRIRSISLFYGFHGGRLLLANNLDEYQKQNGTFQCDDNRVEEFVASGYVYANRTVFKDIYTLQAGEIVAIRAKEISSRRYFEYKRREQSEPYKDLHEFASELDQALLGAFSRMIEQTPDVNRWFVPLSGGHDSRTVANFLHRLGQKNVVCYTYGKPENIQMSSSRQVAEALGFEWHFVEHTEEKWHKLHERGLIDAYIDFAFNGASTPHLQDFLAVTELKEKGIAGPGDVFVPGHTYDFQTGANFGEADMACENRDMVLERVLAAHTRWGDYSSSLTHTIGDIFDSSGVKPRHFQEYFNWQELRSKFTINSLRCYEFHGCDFRIPFWDREVVEFWLKAPDKERAGRKLSFQAEQEGILMDQIASIPFGGNKDRSGKNLLTDFLTWILPGSLKTWLRKISVRKLKMNEALNQI